jgi:hypothetical protein
MMPFAFMVAYSYNYLSLTALADGGKLSAFISSLSRRKTSAGFF